MNHNVRNWNVLNWNIRGLNDEGKAHAMRQKIEESGCSVFCIQETKMKDFTPHSFKRFAPSASRGASGGIMMGSNNSLLQGSVQEVNLFSITVEFVSRLSADHWKLTTVYGPCIGSDRIAFINWLSSLDISSIDADWGFQFLSLSGRQK